MNYIGEEGNIGSGHDNRVAMATKQEITNRTIGQNIGAQIAQHKAEIVRLEGIAAQMRDGASMLDLRIADLRRAMQY